MPSGKRNAIMAIATGLIYCYSTLLHLKMYLFAHHSSSNAYIMVLLKVTSVLLCVPFFFPYHVGDNLRFARYGFGARFG